MPDQDLPNFSRGMSSPFGKYICELKTHVDEHTYDLWLRLCAQHEVTSSELQRDIIYLLAHGHTPAELIAQDRRALLGAGGTAEALSRIGAR